MALEITKEQAFAADIAVDCIVRAFQKPCEHLQKTCRNSAHPPELHKISDSLYDERGTGGQTELARRLGWDASTVRRKLAVKSKITKADALAIRGAYSSS